MISRKGGSQPTNSSCPRESFEIIRKTEKSEKLFSRSTLLTSSVLFKGHSLVVAKLDKWSISTPEIRGLNPVSGKF